MFDGSGGWTGTGERGDRVLVWNSGASVMYAAGPDDEGGYQDGQCDETHMGESGRAEMGVRKLSKLTWKGGKSSKGEEVGWSDGKAWREACQADKLLLVGGSKEQCY
jgi:hypothetical protein